MRLIPADEDEWLLAAFHTVATTFIALTIIPLIWFAFLVPNRYLSKNGGKLTVVDIPVVVERVGERLLHCRPVLVLDLRHAVPGVVGIDRHHPVGMGILRRLAQCVVIDIPHLRPRRGDRAQSFQRRIGVSRIEGSRMSPVIPLHLRHLAHVVIFVGGVIGEMA